MLPESHPSSLPEEEGMCLYSGCLSSDHEDESKAMNNEESSDHEDGRPDHSLHVN